MLAYLQNIDGICLSSIVFPFFIIRQDSLISQETNEDGETELETLHELVSVCDPTITDRTGNHCENR